MRVITNATAVNAAVARQGRKYGYSFQKFAPKRAGKRSAGRESEPPRSGLSSKKRRNPGQLVIERVIRNERILTQD